MSQRSKQKAKAYRPIITPKSDDTKVNWGDEDPKPQVSQGAKAKEQKAKAPKLSLREFREQERIKREAAQEQEQKKVQREKKEAEAQIMAAIREILEELSQKSSISSRKKEKKEDAPQVVAAPAVVSSDAYWAKGVGFGHSGRVDWDPSEYVRKQESINTEILVLLEKLMQFFATPNFSADQATLLEESCLLPFIESYLRDVSFVEMEKRCDTYLHLFTLIQSFTQSPQLAHFVEPLPQQSKSLRQIVKELNQQAKLLLKSEADGDETSSVKLMRKIVGTYQEMEKLLADRQKLAEGKNAEVKKESKEDKNNGNNKKQKVKAKKAKKQGNANPEESGEKKEGKDSKLDEAQLEKEYISSMEQYRFGYVEKFTGHHYTSSGNVSDRKVLRRLQQEFLDLSKSLPIHPDASIFVRASEERANSIQMMIFPASGPYKRGAFLFDAYFPANYPSVPPLMNLMTTGKGTFRFNPNLYECGKVCLSLLGTWSGSTSEKWNPAVSTFLQVAVSVLAQIFVDHPYFNEPGYVGQMHTPSGKISSAQYDSRARAATVKFAMIDQILNPPVGFEYLVRNHFYLQKDNIIKQIEEWLVDGVSTADSLTDLQTQSVKLKAMLEALERPVKPAVDDDEE